MSRVIRLWDEEADGHNSWMVDSDQRLQQRAEMANDPPPPDDDMPPDNGAAVVGEGEGKAPGAPSPVDESLHNRDNPSVTNEWMVGGDAPPSDFEDDMPPPSRRKMAPVKKGRGRPRKDLPPKPDPRVRKFVMEAQSKGGEWDGLLQSKKRAPAMSDEDEIKCRKLMERINAHRDHPRFSDRIRKSGLHLSSLDGKNVAQLEDLLERTEFVINAGRGGLLGMGILCATNQAETRLPDWQLQGWTHMLSQNEEFADLVAQVEINRSLGIKLSPEKQLMLCLVKSGFMVSQMNKMRVAQGGASPATSPAGASQPIASPDDAPFVSSKRQA